MTPSELYRRARSLGLSLWADGDTLVVRPRSKITPELVAELRAHKAELLAWLAGPKESWAVGKHPPGEFDDVVATFPPANRSNPPRPELHRHTDAAAWLHVSKQVLAGEFDGADSSMRQSLIIGLRCIGHPSCREALARLKGAK